MKPIQCMASAALAVVLMGCASAPRVAVQEPVGPCHRVATEGSVEGSLRVLSARRAADVDVNAETYFWNNDFGRNEFMRTSARSGYTIYDGAGRVFRKVSDGQDGLDFKPVRVTLPAGDYTVEARAELSSTDDETVLIPVVIEAGQTTTVDLEPAPLHPVITPDLTQVVQLSDGRVIGCRAQHLVSLHAP